MSNEKNIIRDHPEFPFGDTLAVERLDQWEQSFDPAPDHESGEQVVLRSFLEFVERYVFLERVVQGEIRYELPVHPRFLEQREHLDDPLEQQAAELAQAEQVMLGSPEVPSIELLEDLEDTGIKVVIAGEPENTPHLMGGFFFDGEAGPAFLLGTEADDPRAAFILAHQLGHLIADHDPYRNRICRWHPESLENLDESPTEVRADLFARALLIPEDSLRSYLEHLGNAVLNGESRPENSWRVLQTLFGVPEAVLYDRLLDQGLESLALQLREASTSSTETGARDDSDESPTSRGRTEPEGNGASSGTSDRDGSPDGSGASNGTSDRDGLPDGSGPSDGNGSSGGSGSSDGSGASDGREGSDEDHPAASGLVSAADEEAPPLELRTASGIALPERYLNLGLACYHERVMEEDVLSMFLGLSESDTKTVVEWSQVGRCAETEPGEDDPDSD